MEYPFILSDDPNQYDHCVNCGQDKFFVINVLDVVDCLDEPRCIFDRASTGYILWIDRYAFRPGSLEGHHIFKVRRRGNALPFLTRRGRRRCGRGRAPARQGELYDFLGEHVPAAE